MRQVVQQIVQSESILNDDHRAILERSYIVVEVKDVLFSVPGGKSLVLVPIFTKTLGKLLILIS